MILVTGATGTIGRALLTRLIASDQPIRALTRNVARVRADPHVEPVQGDFADPESLDRAMKGASAAFLLSPGGPASIEADRALVDAALRAGVSKLVKLSSIGAGARYTAGADWHTAGEQAVRATDMRGRCCAHRPTPRTRCAGRRPSAPASRSPTSPEPRPRASSMNETSPRSRPKRSPPPTTTARPTR
jgi:nucleoside-diphosphate-sugar epimerase